MSRPPPAPEDSENSDPLDPRPSPSRDHRVSQVPTSEKFHASHPPRQQTLDLYPGFEDFDIDPGHRGAKNIPKLDKPTALEELMPFYDVSFTPH
jgi:hypothetical protein